MVCCCNNQYKNNCFFHRFFGIATLEAISMQHCLLLFLVRVIIENRKTTISTTTENDVRYLDIVYGFSYIDVNVCVFLFVPLGYRTYKTAMPPGKTYTRQYISNPSRGRSFRSFSYRLKFRLKRRERKRFHVIEILSRIMLSVKTHFLEIDCLFWLDYRTFFKLGYHFVS